MSQSPQPRRLPLLALLLVGAILWAALGSAAVWTNTLGAGERFGMIRFGSRLDVYLPEGTLPLVAVGQTAIAGETVLADLRGGDLSRSFRMG